MAPQTTSTFRNRSYGLIFIKNNTASFREYLITCRWSNLKLSTHSKNIYWWRFSTTEQTFPCCFLKSPCASQGEWWLGLFRWTFIWLLMLHWFEIGTFRESKSGNRMPLTMYLHPSVHWSCAFEANWWSVWGIAACYCNFFSHRQAKIC